MASGVAGVLGGGGGGPSPPSQVAVDDIPPDYLALYIEAADTCPGLDWSILAAIGSVESDHGRSDLPGVHHGSNPKGARGPMQFLPTTFDAYKLPVPPGGSDPPNPYDPINAIHAAARYLCDSGARHARDLHAAIWAYNHSDAYVANVLSKANVYASYDVGADGPGPAAWQAVNYARGQLGLPYVWGGNGPDDGHAGFDCSGLTYMAYASGDITLPRTAQTQYNVGPRLGTDEPLQPGDLVFYGTPTNVHHVGLYIGHDQMIHAPRRGDIIRVAPYRWNGDDYLGATRPG
ncbi:NlpC/P60 family protein [Phytoactinopolyspora endophytica]|uniref:C40 family peptidase n=1 Tax=Phytoactinopolyspora endophytica TaxID=1642495 RepID=UPI003B838EF7